MRKALIATIIGVLGLATVTAFSLRGGTEPTAAAPTPTTLPATARTDPAPPPTTEPTIETPTETTVAEPPTEVLGSEILPSTETPTDTHIPDQPTATDPTPPPTTEPTIEAPTDTTIPGQPPTTEPTPPPTTEPPTETTIPEPHVPNEPLTAVLTLDEGAATSAAIGFSGGTIDGAGFIVTVPKGAVTSTVVITATPGIAVAGTPFDDSLVSFVYLEPSGVRFMHPVTVEWSLPSDPPAELFGFGFEGSGEMVHLIPLSVEGSTARIEVRHFSGAGVAAGSGAAAETATYMSAAGQVASAQLQAYLDQVAAAAAAGSGASIDVAGVEGLLDQWWRLGLEPMLPEVRTHPLQQLSGFQQTQAEAWIAEALAWEHARQTLLGAEGFSVLGEIFGVVDAAIGQANDQCVGGTDAEIAAQFATVLDWQGSGQLLGGEYGPDLSGCVRLLIVQPEMPESINVNTSEPGKFRVALNFMGTGGMNKYDIPAAVSVIGTGGTVSGVDGPEDGWVTFTVNMATTTVEVHGTATYTVGGTELTADSSWTVEPGTSVVVTAASTHIDPGTTTQVTVSVRADGAPAPNVSLSLTRDGEGSLDFTSTTTGPDGTAVVTFTAPTDPGSTTIVATADALGMDGSVTVTYGSPGVRITPAAALVDPGVTVDFTAVVALLDPATVEWSNPDGGTVSTSTGTTLSWVAPSAPGEYRIVATSVANPGLTDTATVTVNASDPGTEPGEFTSGFFYGRRMHECEYEPDWDGGPLHTCDGEVADLLASSGPVWMQIRESADGWRMDFYHQRWFACGFIEWDSTYRDCWITDPADQWRWLAHWYWHERTITTTGPVADVASMPLYNNPPNVLCYTGCPGVRLNLVAYRAGAMELRFFTDSVQLVEGPDGASWQSRWIFEKGAERDPFGTWAFPPGSLVTPEAHRKTT